MRVRVMSSARTLAVALALALAMTAGLAAADAKAQAPSGGTGAATVTQPGPVQAPHWGDALFRVYQGQNFDALTTLMASQTYGRLGPHGDEAEATRGGLLLAYGLHTEAEAIFTALAERGTTAALRDRAWYHLARIRWQRGLAAPAEAALAQVRAPLPADLEEDRVLLAARLRLAQGDAAGAAQRLQALAEQAEGTPYARFNLGVALLAGAATVGAPAPVTPSGAVTAAPAATGADANLSAGRRWLDGLGTMPVTTPQPEERRALRDKANLTLGFDALRRGEPELARSSLARVRLQGPEASKALLGFGWAAAALKQPREALVPWQTLLDRDPSDPAVLEARLAVPWALSELKADGAAIAGYEQAVAAYERERQALDQTIAGLQGGGLVDALLAQNPGADLGWLWQARSLPELPHPAHLAPLLATHGWQEALKDQRDLRFLQGNLSRWAADLQVFDTMLDTRRARFAARLPATQQQPLRQRLQRLQEEHTALSAALATAQAQSNGAALADAREQALLERLARVQAVLAQTPAPAAGASAAPAASTDATTDTASEAARTSLAERARRVAGALEWQLAQSLPARAWEAGKALRGLGQDLDRATGRDAALTAAQRDEPARFDAYAQRIAALRQRIQGLLPQAAALRAEQQQALQALAVQTLREQQARLDEYTTQARFALAQLQDRATLARSDTDREAANAPR